MPKIVETIKAYYSMRSYDKIIRIPDLKGFFKIVDDHNCSYVFVSGFAGNRSEDDCFFINDSGINNGEKVPHLSGIKVLLYGSS